MLTVAYYLYFINLIFFLDPDILNGLKWSAALDSVFKLNAENDTDIMWQYFGSQTGFMRTYPGIYIFFKFL